MTEEQKKKILEKHFDFIMAQIDEAEKRGAAYKGEAKRKAYDLGFKEGEEKARKEIVKKYKLVAGTVLLSERRKLLTEEEKKHIESLKQSQAEEIKLTAEEEQLKKELLDIANGKEMVGQDHSVYEQTPIHPKVGRKFNITSVMIRNIIKRKNWKHI